MLHFSSYAASQLLYIPEDGVPKLVNLCCRKSHWCGRTSHYPQSKTQEEHKTYILCKQRLVNSRDAHSLFEINMNEYYLANGSIRCQSRCVCQTKT